MTKYWIFETIFVGLVFQSFWVCILYLIYSFVFFGSRKPNVIVNIIQDKEDK